MRPCTSTSVLLAAGLVAGLASPSSAQDLMLGGGVGRSGFPELGAPVTVAFHGRIPLSVEEFEPVVFAVVAGGRWGREAGEEIGITCADYWPENAGCVEEPIAWESQVVQLEIGLSAGLAVGPVEVRALVLGAQTLLTAGAEGTRTGRSSGRYYPDSTHRGLAMGGEVVWWGLGLDRLGLAARVRREALDFQGCVTDTATPYCGEEVMTTWELGLSYRLDR